MAIINLPLSISISPSLVQKQILTAIAAHLNKALSSGYQAAVRMRIDSELDTKIKLTKQYGILVGGGRNWGEIGVLNPVTAIAGIVAGLQASMVVDVNPVVVSGAALHGGVTVHVSRADFQDVISSPFSSFPSKGHVVDWLEWMLFAGSRVVLNEWSFKVNHSRASRTRQGVMIKAGRGWSVPSDLQGTSGSNWIIELLGLIEPHIEQIMFEELQRRL